MRVSPVSNVSTKGIQIADIKIKGIDNSYKLYSVNFKDRNFLNKMYKAVNLRKLMPGLYEYDYIIWDEILHTAIQKSKAAYANSILGVCNNKPCGILNYTDSYKMYNLNYVATFPTESKKRVPCAGQILLNELLNRFIQSDKKRIELCAVKDSPFSPVTTYSQLGFSMDGGDNYNEFMSITRERANQTLLKQDEYIISVPVKNKEIVNLENELSLDFIV